jgi:Flp pilus assembly secretin CpaC
VDQNLVIPDGGTVLLGGWKRTREGRNEFGPPVLSKVPYVNRLFKNVGYGRETEYLLVMVTPRVVAHAEEEAPQAAKAAEKKTARRAKGTSAGAMEESEGPADSPRPRKKDRDPGERPAHPPEGPVAELVEAYHQACADGRLDEARKFAALALALDPTCFSRHR